MKITEESRGVFTARAKEWKKGEYRIPLYIDKAQAQAVADAFNRKDERSRKMKKTNKLPVVKIKVFPGGRMPEKKTKGAAAYDCYARLDENRPEMEKVYDESEKQWKIIPYNGYTSKVPLGFALEMPTGVAAFIVPRSSLGLKTGLYMPNSIGVIDSDYRGEVNALLREMNPDYDKGSSIYEDSITNGDRVVQMFFNVPDVELVQVDELNETERGENGFGSTGR